MMRSVEVFLRELMREDALTSCHWRNDPEIWKYTGSRPDRFITEEVELEWIDKVLADDTRKVFAICLKEDSRYVGNVQVTNIEKDEAQFHIFIGDKSVWSKGIGTAATIQMLEIAREKLHLKKLKLWVNMKNLAARKVYLKVGFKSVDETGNMEIEL